MEHPGPARRLYRGLRRALWRFAGIPRQGGARTAVRQPQRTEERLSPEEGIAGAGRRCHRQLLGRRVAGPRTGKRMAGRGVEIWLMREGKIAVWEAAFNFNEVGKPSAMGLT